MDSLSVASRLEMPALATHQQKSTSAEVHQWGQLACATLSKIWQKTCIAVTRQPRKDTNSLSKSFSVHYAIFLLLSHIAHVSSDQTRPCSVPRLALQTIHYQNCIPKRLLNSACSGNCPSYTKTDPNNPMAIQHTCNCCQIDNSTVERVHLRCPSNNTSRRRYIRKTLRVRVIRSCMCRPCTQLPDIQAGEFL